MNAFDYSQASDVHAALEQIGPAPARPDSPDLARFIAGGTNLLDLMKENLVWPARLIDINRLPLAAVQLRADGGLRLGALARNADTAYHPDVREQLPLLSSAILAGASPQIRNMASDAGNLLQRTRCVYFYDALVPCNKRAPGTGCPAREGFARQHAILGASEHCIAVHPSDMCVALAALDAIVHVVGPDGPRAIAMTELHRLPGDTPERDTNLGAGEVIVAVELPPPDTHRAVYLKIRDRHSYAFALISVAVALELDGGVIRRARLALGGVAHRPWRCFDAEAALLGQRPDDALLQQVAQDVFADAQAHTHNAFKLQLGPRAIVRALHEALTETTP